MKDKITIAIAGLGSRGRTAYGAILLDMKDRAQVVAIADFDKTRCEIAQKEHNVKSENVAISNGSQSAMFYIFNLFSGTYSLYTTCPKYTGI